VLVYRLLDIRPGNPVVKSASWLRKGGAVDKNQEAVHSRVDKRSAAVDFAAEVVDGMGKFRPRAVYPGQTWPTIF